MARLLIIEDNLNQRTLYTEELTDDGHEVVSAANGHEALEFFKQQRPDLVIADILLPGMTGIEVMERMLAAEPALPVIIHSAYSSPRLDFVAKTAHAYVLKSGNLDELKHHIRTALTSPAQKLENEAVTQSASDGSVSQEPCFALESTSSQS